MSVFVSAASFDGIGVWMSHLADWMIDAAPFWVPVVAAAAGAAAVGREMLVRSDRDRLSRAARLITIFVPPETDLASAQALWAHLMAVARPAWRRTLFGQPHLTWEYTWDRDGMRIGCWVPGSAPPNLVEAAIESAWPGARTETAWMADQDTPLPVPEDAWVAGGVLRLAEGEHYALRTEFEVDPLRGLIGAVSTIGDGETTCVQICVRPAVGRLRLSGPRRAARALHGTQTANPLSASAVGIAELALPGSANTSGARPGSTDPQATTDVRNILDKAAQPRWEVVIRYAVTTTDPGEHDEAARTARLRGRAHAVASACAIYTGRNRLARHRPRRLAQAMNTRASSRGDLTVLHDQNGLILGPDEPRPDLTFVVVNNDGGGIFSGLPQAGLPGPFERLFGAPHRVDLAAVAASTGTSYRRLDDLAELPDALKGDGLRMIEVCTDRAQAAERRACIARAVTDAVRALRD